MKGSLWKDSRQAFFGNERERTSSLFSLDVVILNEMPGTVATILEPTCEDYNKSPCWGYKIEKMERIRVLDNITLPNELILKSPPSKIMYFSYYY